MSSRDSGLMFIWPLLFTALGSGLGVDALAQAAFQGGGLGAAYLAHGLIVGGALLSGAWLWLGLGAPSEREGLRRLGLAVGVTALPALLGWGHAARAGWIFHALLLPALAAYALIPFWLGRGLWRLKPRARWIILAPLLGAWLLQIGLGLRALLLIPDLETTEALLRWITLAAPRSVSALLIEALTDALLGAPRWPAFLALLSGALLSLSFARLLALRA